MSSPPGNRGEVHVLEPSPAQRAIARRVAEARATIPHYEITADADARRLADSGGEASMAILVKASAEALRRVPRANGAYRDGRFELYSRVNIGVVVPSGDAFATPTLFDADEKSVSELSAELAELTTRARAGELTSPQVSGATFTVTDLSGSAAAAASPVIAPSHAAALSAGAIRAAPVVGDDGILPGRVVTLTLACDHRILYPHEAAALLGAVKSGVEGGGS